MATKTRIERRKEVWQAKLGVSLAGVEGVRLGWCKYDGRLYSPAKEMPDYVVSWLGLRVEPADEMWPYYIDAAFKTIGEVIAAANSGDFTLVSFDESIIEFEVDVVETIEEPVVAEVDWDTAYSVCGYGYPEDKARLGGDGYLFEDELEPLEFEEEGEDE